MTIRPETVRALLPRRPVDAHKGSCGTVLSVCGSYGMAGAACFAAAAALRCGAGMVRAALPGSIYPIFSALLPEAVCLPDLSDRQLCEQVPAADSMVIGCGLGTADVTAARLRGVLAAARQTETPVVLDADGINLAAAHTDIAEQLGPHCVLTPHPGEAARLLHCTPADIALDRRGTVDRLVRLTGAVVVLKGHDSLVAAPDGTCLCNPTGNPGMATAGMGDVLAGMIASLAAQGLTPRDAAVCGTYLHGLAGDEAAAAVSQRALLPRDLLRQLTKIFLAWEASPA